MQVAVFGAGYVGLVTGACLADLGHDVAVRDVVVEKIDVLRRGQLPIHEEGLAELLERNRDRLSFTTDVDEAVEGCGRRLHRGGDSADVLRRRGSLGGVDRGG